MKNNLQHQSSGFSLIELMIVVAIIALLAAISIPSYQTQIQKSRRADAMDSLLDCAAAQARYFTSQSPQTYFDQDIAVDERLCNLLSSKDDHYGLAIENENCDGLAPDTFWCFSVVATADADKPQVNDTQCSTWSIDHRGRKRALNSDDEDTTETCWRI